MKNAFADRWAAGRKAPALRAAALTVALASAIALAAGCSARGSLSVAIDSPSSDVTILTGSTVDFASSVGGGVAPYEVEWDFGGKYGFSGEDPGPVLFTEPGVHGVICRASDSLLGRGTASVTVTVKDIIAAITSPAPGSAFGLGDQANFQAEVTGGVAPFTYSWDFAGRAPASAVEDPGSVSFTSSGAFNATFTVTDSLGASDTASVQIEVVPPYEGRTEAEVRAYWSAVRPTLGSVTFSFAPVLAVDDTGFEGALDQDLIDEGIAWVNFYRWLAGLPDDVVEDPVFKVRCQKGSHVLVMLEILNQSYSSPHYPPLPAGSSAGYEADVYGGAPSVSTNTGGYVACASSNIYMGWGGGAYTPAVTVDGYMDDYGNDSTLGHRRWILYPRLGRTAFGAVQGSGQWASAMYVVERPSFTAPSPVFDFVAYPSPGHYPIQCFSRQSAIWSFSVNSAKYGMDASTVARVVRLSDGQDLGAATSLKSSGYGISPTIGFTPNEAVEGETYRVTIQGVIDNATSGRFDHEYTVAFFDLTD